MKAAYLAAPRQLRIGDYPVPKVGPDDVLIQVEVTGICGSDVEVYNGIYPEMKFPVIMGHETSGTVAKLGENVTKFKIGDRVTPEPSWGCGKCYFCKNSKYFYSTSNHCIDPQRLGRSVGGSFAEYTAVPADVVYLMPDNVTFDEAQSNTTLACACHGFRRSNIAIGDVVLVLGTGHLGLLAVQVAKAYGAGKVIAVDIVDKKLEMARDLGADVTINPNKEDTVKRVLELTDDIGPDIVAEATGLPDVFKTAIATVKPTGRVMQFGIAAPPGTFGLNAIRLMYKEIELVGTASGRGCYPTALNLLSTGRVKVDRFITHRFPLDELEKGIEVIEKKIGDPMRVLVNSRA